MKKIIYIETKQNRIDASFAIKNIQFRNYGNAMCMRAGTTLITLDFTPQIQIFFHYIIAYTKSKMKSLEGESP